MLIIGKRFLVKRKREKKMNKIKLYWNAFSPNLYFGALGLLVFVGTGMILSIPLWLLWNWLMPYIFGLPTLNILQVFGLSIMFTLLSPKEIRIPNLKNQKKIVNSTDDINEKLEKVLKDITSQFSAQTIYIHNEWRFNLCWILNGY